MTGTSDTLRIARQRQRSCPARALETESVALQMFEDDDFPPPDAAPIAAAAGPASLARGREFLAIPGPTNVPEAVLQAMQRPAVDIYVADLLAITESCRQDLAAVFRTGGSLYLYIANGHGAWEAALTNALSAR